MGVMPHIFRQSFLEGIHRASERSSNMCCNLLNLDLCLNEYGQVSVKVEFLLSMYFEELPGLAVRTQETRFD